MLSAKFYYSAKSKDKHFISNKVNIPTIFKVMLIDFLLHSI